MKPFEEDCNVRWDCIGREVDYWRAPETTVCEEHLMIEQKGDFDIIGLANKNEQAYIVEVKTNQSAANKGYKQLKKDEKYFQALR